ncbi:MAG: hypothetical protein ACYS8W_02705 [Planctomycetota bacterium]|jgi:hypothetical protein
MKSARKKTFSSQRRRFENYREGIKGDLITAPARPFAWWGPFNMLDAIGRTVILIGLWSMGLMFATVSASTPRDSDIPEGLLTYHPALYMLLAGGLFIASGAALIKRRMWALRLAKCSLYFAPFLPPLTLVLAGIDGKISIVLIVFSVIAGILMSVSLWAYIREISVRYEFEYVQYGRLEKTKNRTQYISASASGFFVGAIAFVLLSESAFVIEYVDGKEILGSVVLFCGYIIPFYLAIEAIRFLFMKLDAKSNSYVYPWERQVETIRVRKSEAGNDVRRGASSPKWKMCLRPEPAVEKSGDTAIIIEGTR